MLVCKGRGIESNKGKEKNCKKGNLEKTNTMTIMIELGGIIRNKSKGIKRNIRKHSWIVG